MESDNKRAYKILQSGAKSYNPANEQDFSTFGGSMKQAAANQNMARSTREKTQNKSAPILDNDLLQMLALQAKAIENLIR